MSFMSFCKDAKGPGRAASICTSLAVAVVVLVFLVLYRGLTLQFITGGDLESCIISMLSSWKYLVAGLLVFVLSVVATYCFVRYADKIVPILYRRRVVIGIIVVVLCTLFEISGSSIGMWSKTLPDASSDGLVLGTPRWFRTDEFATTMAEVFAQFNDPSGYLPYFGTVFRGTQTDMFVSGIPVFDLAAIIRPFSWGYILFGLSRGLAFYWSARCVALFLLTFEVALRLMGKKKKLAFPIATLVTFSSAVCWWGSADILIYSEALYLVGVRFFSSRSTAGWMGWSATFFWLLGALVATLYPAWIVPYALLFLCLGVAYLVQHKSEMCFSPRKQLLCCVPGILMLVILGMHIVSLSSDAMTLLSSTSYPGARTDFGGGDPAYLFRSLTSLFTPISVEGLSTDRPDSISSIMCLYPTGMLLAAYLVVKKRRFDPTLIALFAVEAFYSVYFLFGLPEIVARVTLMSFTIPERTAVVIELIDLLLMVKALSLFEIESARRALCLSAVLAGVFSLLNYVAEPGYYDFVKIVIAFSFCLCFAYFFFVRSALGMAIVSIAIALFSGVLVNPVQVGVSVVEDNVLIRDIRELAQESDKKWITQTDWAENIAAFAGASTINSTQYYPNFEFWETLDPETRNKEIYNRFSHPRVTLTIAENAEPSIELSGTDVISVTLPVSYLKELNVGYVLTQGDLNYLNSNDCGIEFSLLRTYGGYSIYEVGYE